MNKDLWSVAQVRKVGDDIMEPADGVYCDGTDRDEEGVVGSNVISIKVSIIALLKMASIISGSLYQFSKIFE